MKRLTPVPGRRSARRALGFACALLAVAGLVLAVVACGGGGNAREDQLGAGEPIPAASLTGIALQPEEGWPVIPGLELYPWSPPESTLSNEELVGMLRGSPFALELIDTFHRVSGCYDEYFSGGEPDLDVVVMLELYATEQDAAEALEAWDREFAARSPLAVFDRTAPPIGDEGHSMRLGPLGLPHTDMVFFRRGNLVVMVAVNYGTADSRDVLPEAVGLAEIIDGKVLRLH